MVCLHTRSGMAPQPKPPKPERSQCSQSGEICRGNEHSKALAPECYAKRCTEQSCVDSQHFAREEASFSQSFGCMFHRECGRECKKLSTVLFCVPISPSLSQISQWYFPGKQGAAGAKRGLGNQASFECFNRTSFLTFVYSYRSSSFYPLEDFTSKILPGASWRFGRWQWTPWVSLKLV